MTRASGAMKQAFDLIDIFAQMDGDDLSNLARLFGPLVEAIANDGNAARRVVLERVATDDSAGKIFAFCRTGSPFRTYRTSSLRS